MQPIYRGCGRISVVMVNEKGQDARITVRIQANAHQNMVAGFQEGILYIKIAAPPVKGRANQELIRFLSDILGIRKSDLSIEKGQTSKNKIIAVRGLSQKQVENLLNQHTANEDR